MKRLSVLLAKVDIGVKFGFGNIKTLGEVTARVVAPIFSVAAFLVLQYYPVFLELPVFK